MAIAVMILLAAAVPLLSGMPHSEKHENRRVIDNLEETWRNAALKGNSAAMDSLLADDYMAITPTGVMQSKEQTLALDPQWNTSLQVHRFRRSQSSLLRNDRPRHLSRRGVKVSVQTAIFRGATDIRVSMCAIRKDSGAL